MRVPLEAEKQIEREKIAAYVVGHLPIVKAYAIKIGLVDIINELIPSKMDVDPGTIFLGMVMDTLSGRTPLYRLDEFFKDQDTELLLGKRVNPAVLTIIMSVVLLIRLMKLAPSNYLQQLPKMRSMFLMSAPVMRALTRPRSVFLGLTICTARMLKAQF